MNERAADPLASASSLLWLMAVVVAVFSAQVAIGYTRQALREPRRRARVLCLAAAALVLGTGIWSAMLLGVSSDALPYPLGYRALGLAAGWLCAVLPAALAMAMLARWRRPLVVVAAGVLVGAGAVATDWVLVLAAGLLPGISWQYETIGLAGPLVASGCVGGLWIAFLAAGYAGRWRRSWRIVAAGMVGFSIIVGQELVLAAAVMSSQLSSIYRREVPATALCLLAGIAVPMLLLVLMLDLRMRRHVLDPNALPPRKRQRVRRGRSLDG